MREFSCNAVYSANSEALGMSDVAVQVLRERVENPKVARQVKLACVKEALHALNELKVEAT